MFDLSLKILFAIIFKWFNAGSFNFLTLPNPGRNMFSNNGKSAEYTYHDIYVFIPSLTTTEDWVTSHETF